MDDINTLAVSLVRVQRVWGFITHLPQTLFSKHLFQEGILAKVIQGTLWIIVTSYGVISMLAQASPAASTQLKLFKAKPHADSGGQGITREPSHLQATGFICNSHVNFLVAEIKLPKPDPKHPSAQMAPSAQLC